VPVYVDTRSILELWITYKCCRLLSASFFSAPLAPSLDSCHTKVTLSAKITILEYLSLCLLGNTEDAFVKNILGNLRQYTSHIEEGTVAQTRSRIAIYWSPRLLSWRSRLHCKELAFHHLFLRYTALSSPNYCAESMVFNLSRFRTTIFIANYLPI